MAYRVSQVNLLAYLFCLGEIPVFHYFIVILPFWPNNLLPVYKKISCCAIAGLNALSSTIYQFSCHYLLITYPKTLDSIT